MTPVAEQEKLKIDLKIEDEVEEAEKLEEPIDMEWQVETEPAPQPAPVIETEVTTSSPNTYYETNRQYRTTRSCNKHLFTWLFSVVLGMYGIDRFVRGQIALGLIKLFTGGGFGFWYLADAAIAIYKSYFAEYASGEDVFFDDAGNYTWE